MTPVNDNASLDNALDFDKLKFLTYTESESDLDARLTDRTEYYYDEGMSKFYILFNTHIDEEDGHGMLRTASELDIWKIYDIAQDFLENNDNLSGYTAIMSAFNNAKAKEALKLSHEISDCYHKNEDALSGIIADDINSTLEYFTNEGTVHFSRDIDFSNDAYGYHIAEMISKGVSVRDINKAYGTDFTIQSMSEFLIYAVHNEEETLKKYNEAVEELENNEER